MPLELQSALEEREVEVAARLTFHPTGQRSYRIAADVAPEKTKCRASIGFQVSADALGKDEEELRKSAISKEFALSRESGRPRTTN